MAKVAVTEECTFHVTADASSAYEFFSKPHLFREAMEGVLRCEVMEEDRVRWLLEEQSDQGIRFQPDYTVQYTCEDGQRVAWEFIEGNLRNDGEIRIATLPDGGSEIHYRETVEPDLPITPLMMMLVKPLVTRELRTGLQHFVQRSQVRLSA
ncbi:SRPBCC family protein [Aporhodopirellula aestuarii]|uniref:SRPBCC family protein n=1 Tax=Aporhodopirellula aestuarii TaxID=2950107 RepID=A0ABT0U3R4_9BACT|nr:SRPBCC family protein [Aporhodopirellula aestuarii]MCM2371551.1 SRPBCC family protein [Aporhodopirellula aestuarii]